MTKAKKISFRKTGGSNKVDNEYVKSLESDLVSPKAILMYCAVASPCYYPNNRMPRYKVGVVFNPDIPEHNDFLLSLEKKAARYGIEKFGVKDDEDCTILFFQGKELPKTKLVEFGKKRAINIEMETDFPTGVECSVKFDLKSYKVRSDGSKSFSMPPSEITFYLDEESQKQLLAD